jgi:hypothetical protein
MWWPMALGALALGCGCGVLLRFPFFLSILFSVAFFILLGHLLRPMAGGFLLSLISILTLQIGYGLGVILRAAIRSLYVGRRSYAQARQDNSVQSSCSEQRWR